jgi:glycosyltransferase involved in cell wall biosynthesis
MTNEKFVITHLKSDAEPPLKVSVVLLAYNQEKFIEQAIYSILMQKTKFNFEILIAEDFSTDNTRNIVLEFQKKYPDKIGVLLPDRNLNSNKYFLQVLQMARGEYIALLDGDDFWTSPHKLQKQVDFLENHNECVICCHNVEIFKEENPNEVNYFNPPNQKKISSINDLWQGNFIATCSVLFRAKLVNKIPDWYDNAQYGDWELHLVNAQHGKIGYINEVMGKYRMHSGGIWSSLKESQQIHDCIRCYKSLNKNFDYKYLKVIKPNIALQYYFLSSIYKKSGELDKAKSFIHKYFKEMPVIKWFFRIRPIILLVKLYNPFFSPVKKKHSKIL